MLTSRSRRVGPWIIGGICVGVAVAGLLAIMGLWTDERFTEKGEVVVGRDLDGIFFATCPGHVVDQVVVQEGEPVDAPVVWRGDRTGNGSPIVRTEPLSQDYDIEGDSLSAIDAELSIANFRIDDGVAAIPAYVTFNPSGLDVGMAVTGAGERVSIDSWRASCGSEED